jgi:hypothetical protein
VTLWGHYVHKIIHNQYPSRSDAANFQEIGLINGTNRPQLRASVLGLVKWNYCRWDL